MDIQLFRKLNKKIDDVRSELYKHEPSKDWVAGIQLPTGDYRIHYFYTEEEAKDYIHNYTDYGRFKYEFFIAKRV